MEKDNNCKKFPCFGFTISLLVCIQNSRRYISLQYINLIKSVLYLKSYNYLHKLYPKSLNSPSKASVYQVYYHLRFHGHLSLHESLYLHCCSPVSKMLLPKTQSQFPQDPSIRLSPSHITLSSLTASTHANPQHGRNSDELPVTHVGELDLIPAFLALFNACE